MYRVNKNYDESSSDDEGPSLRKEQKLDSTDDAVKDCKAGSKAAQMWTDLLAEQSLAETFSDKVGVYQGRNDMVERGIESYILPDVRCTNNDQEMRHQINRKILPAANDSEPFDFIADEEKIGRFSDTYERCPRTYGDGSEIRNKQGSVSFSNQEENSKQLPKHFAFMSQGNRKRRRNNYDPNTKNGNRVANNKKNVHIALNRRRRDVNSISLSTSDDSLDLLSTAEFPLDISVDELADRIVRALGERNGKFLQRVIFEIGKEKALELFEATRGIEASGGMMTADSTRRRTPGGVFMTLFKTDPDILPVLKEKVCNLQKATAREIRTARRKAKREAAKAFDNVDRNVEMLEKLPTSSEVLLKNSQ